MTPWADPEGHFRPDVFARAVSQGLSPEERQRFDNHLKVCPRCRGLLAVQQRSGRGPNAITLDGLSPATARSDGETTLPVGEVTLGHHPTALGEGNVDPTSISGQALRPVGAPAAANANALTHPDLPSTIAPTLAAGDPLIGRKLGDYVVLELIARGGMAAVYRGIQPVIGKQVAIKVLLPVTNEHDFAQRMVQEAQTVNAIAHPNIIDIFGAGSLADGRPWLVMELLTGKSVAEWVRTSPGPIAATIVMSVLEQMCSALEAAHAAGVVHRDIKPANVMLTHLDEPVPRVKVVDFGLAKSGDMSLRTAPDVVLGTPGFVSPEQIQGQRATPLSDLYSAGLVGWFMLGRKDPYPRDEHVLATMKRQLSQEPASLVGVAGIPVDLGQLIAELCRIDPARRPRSALEVRERLSRLLAANPALPDGTVPDLPQVPTTNARPARRRTHDEFRHLGPDVTPKEALRAGDMTPPESVNQVSRTPDVTPKEALNKPLMPAFHELTPLMVPDSGSLKLDPPRAGRPDATVVQGAAPPPSVPVWAWVALAMLVAAGVAAVVAVS